MNATIDALMRRDLGPRWWLQNRCRDHTDITEKLTAYAEQLGLSWVMVLNDHDKLINSERTRYYRSLL